MRVYLGRLALEKSSPTETMGTVRRVIKHPFFIQSTMANDIALLELSSPVKFTDYIRPVCLAAEGSEFIPGTDGWITGWGYAKTSGRTLPLLCCCYWQNRSWRQFVGSYVWLFANDKNKVPLYVFLFQFPYPLQRYCKRSTLMSFPTPCVNQYTALSAVTTSVPIPLLGKASALWVLLWKKTLHKLIIISREFLIKGVNVLNLSMLTACWFNWFYSVQGDAGGPLLLKHGDKWVQAGVTSFMSAAGCGVSNVPDGYTRVSGYQPWILKQITTNPPGFVYAGTSQLVSLSVPLLVAVSLFVSLFHL